MKTNSIIRSLLFTGICLLAAKTTVNAQNLFNLAVPGGSFETNGPGNSGSPYANQSPVPYSPYPTAELFTGWTTSTYNYQAYRVSTAGDTGSFQGSYAVQLNYPGLNSVNVTLNPVTTIIHNATYTLTFALATPNGTASGVTLSLFTATSAADPTDYSAIPPYYLNPTNGLPYGPNPTPVITPTDVLGSSYVSGATIDAQGNGHFTDYTVSFNTLGTNNSAVVGQGLYLGLTADYTGASTLFDNARLTELAVVPEPSTWALMLAGLGGLFFVGRRKLKA